MPAKKRTLSPEQEKAIKEMVAKIQNIEKEYQSLDEDDDDNEKVTEILILNANQVLELMQTYYEGTVSQTTLDKQLNDLAFYFDHKIRYEGESVFESLDESSFNEFLGDWYISHALWSTPTTTKRYITAFNKLVAMLEAVGLLSKKRMKEIKDILKENKAEWIYRMELFNGGPDLYDDYRERVHGFDPFKW